MVAKTKQNKLSSCDNFSTKQHTQKKSEATATELNNNEKNNNNKQTDIAKWYK